MCHTEAASELHMPLSLHVITGKSKESKVDFSRISLFYMNLIHEVQRSLSTLVFGGVLERFPKLKIVSAENDTGWFPHFMYRMDHAHEKFHAMEKEPLPMKPSEYVRRQVWATFQDDPVGPATYKIFGEDNYMWASDFPHTDSTWPESRQWIKKDFDGVPEDVTRPRSQQQGLIPRLEPHEAVALDIGDLEAQHLLVEPLRQEIHRRGRVCARLPRWGPHQSLSGIGWQL